MKTVDFSETIEACDLKVGRLVGRLCIRVFHFLNFFSDHLYN